MTKVKKETKKVYDFGEKTEEYHSKLNKNLPVWQSPKYKESKGKAIELIESTKYSLSDSDFWILKNATKTGKMMYTGLIISHNGCLKINNSLDDKLKFKPTASSFVKDEAEKIKVMSYINDEQGIYEFGEISPKNCMNDYPYAMVLKRLFDRVVLKNSKVGFFGIFSEAESEDFKEDENKEDKKEKEQSYIKLKNQLVADIDNISNITEINNYLKNTLGKHIEINESKSYEKSLLNKKMKELNLEFSKDKKEFVEKQDQAVSKKEITGVNVVQPKPPSINFDIAKAKLEGDDTKEDKLQFWGDIQQAVKLLPDEQKTELEQIMGFYE